MKKRAMLSLALLAFAAGCSFKSPAEGLDFKAPSGWKTTPSIMGMQMWMKEGTRDGQVLMLFNHSGGKVKSLNDFDMRTVPVTGKGGRVTSEQPIRICGNHQPAKYFSMSGETNGKPTIAEVVVTLYDRDNLFLSVYSRPKTAQPDAQAETALRSLCLKST